MVYLLLFLAALSITPSPLVAAKFSSSQINFFERKIRPVLVAKCYDCHSHDAKIKAVSLSIRGRVSCRAGTVVPVWSPAIRVRAC